MSLPWSFSPGQLALLVALPLVGCGYGHGSHHDPGYDDLGSSAACGELEEAVIDADEQLEVDAGAGAGAFVEYESGGRYRITTTCDADESGACYWDILVTPLDGAPVLSLSPVDLEGDDSLSFGADGSVRLVASTGSDFDGFLLETDPGAAIRFDALLDQGCANRYLFWVGDGALHSGAPSNPVDLVPDTE